MKASINPPSTAVDANSYQLECQFALEPSLRSLADKAQQSGWEEAHVLLAMLSYASERITSLEHNQSARGFDETH